ncbi:MAG: VWA domain-containing protein [Caldilineaceae bacterium]|nr:VWA domain-containing protein [Caldilineaceae bacterium]MBP8108884.1 VWA domain-containing protein [Caldilineaceae bacterium]MBP8122931.1 VWA domain-containing protein [Caldilineaceae bacterium]MBP9073055.1 VWA domain-containing protein [Caldilineaceae bacterium]
MVQFISALRAGGVRVSLAESADAFRAVEDLGIQDRATFKLGLRATLVKDASALPAFDELFPLFFDTTDAPPLMDLTQDMSEEEANMLAEALRQFSDKLREMLEKLLKGEQLSQQELEQLGQLVGLNSMDDLRYREWMAKRMQQAMNFKQVRTAIDELSELMAQMGMNRQRMEQMRQLLQANMQGLAEQMSQFAGQRIAQNMSETRPEENLDGLMNRPFTALSDGDMQTLRHEVRRLAALLRSRIALRQKRAKSGQLDAKATIRANMKHGSVPIELKHRNRRLKPKLVVICDVSTSMRYCSELMLSLIYALQDLVTKTHAFVFIDHLEYITPDFVGRDANEAVDQVLVRMPPGYYSTDLGYALDGFDRGFMDTLDTRTTLIVVGDGRNNHNDPRLEIFTRMARRANRTLWLNPEPPVMWGSGDSDMLKYAPICDTILQVSTLAELTAAVDKMLVN